MCKHLYQLQSEGAAGYEFWREFCWGFHDHLISEKRSPCILHAIRSVAKSEVGVAAGVSYAAIDIDTDQWIALLRKTSNSGEIWDHAIVHLHEDLLKLMTHCKLKFYEPHCPLSRQEFLSLRRVVTRLHNIKAQGGWRKRLRSRKNGLFAAAPVPVPVVVDKSSVPAASKKARRGN